MKKIENLTELLNRYGCGPIAFSGTSDALFERRLVLDHVIDPKQSGPREQFEAFASAMRDVLAQRWLKTTQTYDAANPKQVYYLSMEFLIGRSLTSNVTNLGVAQALGEWEKAKGIKVAELVEEEPDAGLGNGGLGRLAACFIESLATLEMPAIGYGLRYDYGIFRQEIVNGYQVEQPDPWLNRPDPWEVARPNDEIPVPLGASFTVKGGEIAVHRGHATQLIGVPFDRPIVGFGGKTINTLRLWKATTAAAFDFGEFSSGDFFGAVSDKTLAESVTRVLYPDDSTQRGRSLRFLQEYFLVRCSLADIIARFRRRGNDWSMLPDKVAIQLNDTHPAMAVPELMRILLDEANLSWENAWDLSTRTLAYTNHTLLPEALEKWPVELFEALLPRHLEIIFEINRRFLNDVQLKHPEERVRLSQISLIEEGNERKVRMAHLAIVGSHSTNGVAEIHSKLLRTKTVPEFAELFPERFNNKTNGVTPRRWLLQANPNLAQLITETVGAGWETNMALLRKIDPLAKDAAFQARFLAAKRSAKTRFVDWIKKTADISLDPDTLFDVQIKRIHEYKRQLLNAIQVIICYNRLLETPSLDVPPRTVLFAGKAAPAYHLAKVIIKLITSIARVVNSNPMTRNKLRVAFLPNYSCTLAEYLIPAADVSEQISTAGFEASGTSNMKFMMNGAITLGTRDGANIEISEEVGEENAFMFGLTSDQVLNNRALYNPHWHYENEPETKAALDMIFGNYFSADEPGIFEPIRETLLTKGDYFMHLADLTEYVATQSKVAKLFQTQNAWAEKAIHNVARSGKFSSDRTIEQYAHEIWDVKPCPVLP
ncbi:Glycogen phosphorylase [Pirellula sp. SH-Sr6A]|uniref:glycogen/starch/alpha-glucan phosphorylase n=1 Tax=Pirellula sp. SH-Sr6A TaxID=1632865 RepID=UPI00078B2CA6|nr:glycogen/starch/alpha-glucan phosphorylase [Pirellula sp. SH-Sr6A]AMV32453.1 Glycogen phosphorylase [Pirellula sp. SH-Sr6A]